MSDDTKSSPIIENSRLSELDGDAPENAESCNSIAAGVTVWGDRTEASIRH